MSEIKNIAQAIVGMMDRIVRNKVQNSIMLGMYERLILPFFNNQIQNTPDEEIKIHLQYAYDQLKPYFENKQFKDQIDEGDKLSGFKLSDHGILKSESKYF